MHVCREIKHQNLVSHNLIRVKFPPWGDIVADISSISPSSEHQLRSDVGLTQSMSTLWSLHGENLTLAIKNVICLIPEIKADKIVILSPAHVLWHTVLLLVEFLSIIY